MELNRLQGFVLMIVMTGLLVGVGITTFNSFGAATYYSVDNVNNTISAANWVNESWQSLTFGNVTSWDRVVNNTGGTDISTVCYETNSTAGTIRFINQSADCELIPSVEVIYDYKDYNTKTTEALNSVAGETANINSDWLGLIVTIVILSIILLLVIRSFNPGR